MTASLSSSRTNGTTGRTGKPYARACANCRKKKVRCNGGRPSCSHCTTTYLTTCVYDEPLSYKTSESILHELQGTKRLLDLLVTDPSSFEVVRAQWQSQRGVSASPEEHVSATQSQAAQSESVHDHGSNDQGGHSPISFNFATETVDELSPELVAYLQSIYLTWQWPLHCFIDRTKFIDDLKHDNIGSSCQLLLYTALAHASRFSSRVLSAPSSTLEMDKVSARFLERSKLLMYKQIEERPTITAASAILMLASREVACASFSQAWIYSGIAVRTLEELDVIAFVSTQCIFPFRHQTLTKSDQVEARRAWQLYKSCYTFDKTLSFGLGKTPALQQLDNRQPMLDTPAELYEEDEGLLWPDVPSPLDSSLLQGHDSSAMLPEHYTPRPHHPHRTFAEFYKLSLIFGSVLAFKSPLQAQLSTPKTSKLARDLRAWKENLPSCINISHPELEHVSPPPNVITLNVVYQVCTILLYGMHLGPTSESAAVAASAKNAAPDLLPGKPHDVHQSAQNMCSSAAIEIHKLLELWSRTFTFDRMTWLFGCCIYTAAIVHAFDAQSEEHIKAHDAAERLNFALKALIRSASFTPGIRKSTSAILELVNRTYARRRPNGVASVMDAQTLLQVGQARPDTATTFTGPHHGSATPSTSHNTDRTFSTPDFDMALLIDDHAPPTIEADNRHQTTVSSSAAPHHEKATQPHQRQAFTSIESLIETDWLSDDLIWDTESLLSNASFLEAFGNLPLQPSFGTMDF